MRKIVHGDKHQFYSRIIIESDVLSCCLIDITGERAGDHDSWIGVGILSDFGHCDFTWRDRIRMSYKALCNTLWGHHFEFYTRGDADRFIAAMTTMRDIAFPIEESPEGTPKPAPDKG